jgi:hypothetical protein
MIEAVCILIQLGITLSIAFMVGWAMTDDDGEDWC